MQVKRTHWWLVVNEEGYVKATRLLRSNARIVCKTLCTPHKVIKVVDVNKKD